jgi:hypothetical protein
VIRILEDMICDCPSGEVMAAVPKGMWRATYVKVLHALRARGQERVALRWAGLIPDLDPKPRQEMVLNVREWDELEQQKRIAEGMPPGDARDELITRAYNRIFEHWRAKGNHVIVALYHRPEKDEGRGLLGYQVATCLRMARLLSSSGVKEHLLLALDHASWCIDHSDHQPMAFLIRARLQRDMKLFDESAASYTSFLQRQPNRGVEEELERVRLHEHFDKLSLEVISSLGEVDHAFRVKSAPLNPGKGGKGRMESLSCPVLSFPGVVGGLCLLFQSCLLVVWCIR